ncbi:tRNA (5-methylaminomethyl-2-thiouridine)(34)-methyltransferase MnmD [Robertkochia sediminum]|uniref:tRNA (5-methylaminomethyl-2-thiouridine)(34)-methyltransferase MnmD n=1 Tax=Robertkochia sediminum TaxID=2785326 RepID=UPI0019320186|nr:tRNA (5-methylaminomethyl-2-thiouridine)(34)-methyltransferase MnmD [Robertkochia sediminum]MBL7472278.1 tRNA (5-methylaminomethyl-2-thiouridine)(34)-methyltransferase MnmD [Robertkochia sediminum]
MERKIIKTADGSTTIYIKGWDEHYHSKHGAIQEAYHVFIRMGLDLALESEPADLRIMEIGFGTGLNAFITLLETQPKPVSIDYTGVEGYPVAAAEWKALNYAKELQATPEQSALFERMHEEPWEAATPITPEFALTKRKQLFDEIEDEDAFDLIYFDAFGARVQPELWEEAIFNRMFRALSTGGILVTYAAKGSVRRAMQAVGFLVEKLPGPPGKREMLRAIKPDASQKS